MPMHRPARHPQRFSIVLSQSNLEVGGPLEDLKLGFGEKFVTHQAEHFVHAGAGLAPDRGIKLV
jgi:hypothetical protein